MRSGVGDRLIIGSETFYILSRDDATHVTVQTAATSTHTNEAYTITRAYNDIQSWETGQQGDLVAGNRIEVGVAYKDGVFTPTATITIDGSTTDAVHYMSLTVAPGQRHNGTAGTGVIVDGGSLDSGRHSPIPREGPLFQNGVARDQKLLLRRHSPRSAVQPGRRATPGTISSHT